ncbi:MAG: hypothetical protein L6R40_005220 [Gallowayella cf. fulva]|nr:MAG: hypothetical protein L6R40_005220 [Xanthomendoza cf. fulva]
MTLPISSSIVACLKAFNRFIDEIQDTGVERQAGLVVQRWQDELGRLRIWAANIGAHQTNQSSLDYRLRDSLHIRHQITKLLDDLTKRLREAGESFRNNKDEDDDIESLEGSSSEDEESKSETQQLHGSVATIISCLFQMSMLVRKPAQHDLRMASRKADVVHYEHYDYKHVSDKYRGADDMIVSRLGRAITLRRKYLKYRERHAMKLKQGLNNAAGDKSIKDNATSAGALSETVVTDVQCRNIDFQDNASDSGISQTSYAPTLMTGGNITIPAPPRASQGGEPFECPYCHFIITAQSTRSWNRHVFNDLQPYICIEKSCITPDKLYATRHTWIHHRRTAHPIENPTEQHESHSCALCGETQDTEDRHERHVARHLQELALFVLPRNDEDLDEHSDEDEHGDPPHPEEEEDYKIKCICGFDEDDGNTVWCEGCDTWQHTQCYYFKDGEVADEAYVINIEHSCADCQPRQLDIRGAIERQTRRGELQRRRDASRSSKSRSSASEEENIEGVYGDHERLTFPKKQGYIDALSELGHSFTYQGHHAVVSKALSRKEIHEIFSYIRERSVEWPSDEAHETSMNNDSSLKSDKDEEEEADERAKEEMLLTEAKKAAKVKEEEEFEEPGGGETDFDPEKYRPTYIKVLRKYMSVDTLDAYGLPWEWDDRDSNYIVIKRWINEHDQDGLFEHTRKLREDRLQHILLEQSKEWKTRKEESAVYKNAEPPIKEQPTSAIEGPSITHSDHEAKQKVMGSKAISRSPSPKSSAST